MAHSEVSTKLRPVVDLKEPPLYKVVYLNDNQTTYEFVTQTLMEYFDYSIETADKITMDIHEAGSAVVAVLPYEIAEQKGIEVTMLARQQQYPLQIKLEPESA